MVSQRPQLVVLLYYASISQAERHHLYLQRYAVDMKVQGSQYNKFKWLPEMCEAASHMSSRADLAMYALTFKVISPRRIRSFTLEG